MTAGNIVVISEEAGGRKGNYFDGVDDYVLHDAHAVARVAAGDTVGTYTAWIYFDDVSGNYTIISAGDNSSTDEFLQFFLQSDGRLSALLKHGGAIQWQIRESTPSISARKWTHVALVQNGVQPALYIDGLNVAVTNSTATDLTFWYDELTLTDKFAIGVLESNATHINDLAGAIGRTKYFVAALTPEEIMEDFKEVAFTSRPTALETARVFDISMDTDGITDSGSGADNGSLTGHAAEFMNTFIDGSKYVTIIKKGD